MAWLTASDLELALGTTTYTAIFDDGDGAANALAVAQVLNAAHADVTRFAYRGWDGPIPDPPPPELFYLELDFARARAFFRGDMYTRDTGSKIFEAARETAKDIAANLVRGGLEMPNPTPALSEPAAFPERSSASFLREGSDLACTDALMFWRGEGRCCRR